MIRHLLAAMLLASLVCCFGCDADTWGPPSPGPAPSPLVPQHAPVAKITGPSTAMPGEIVELSATESKNATSFEWQQLPECVTTKIVPRENGRACQVSSFPGVHKIMLVASNAKGASIAWHTLTVSGAPLPPGPEPDPGPGPGPGPQPAPPPGPMGEFGQFVYAEAMKVDSPNRAAEAHAMSEKCRALSSQMAATQMDSNEVLRGLESAMQESGVSGRPWSGFRSAIKSKLKWMWVGGKLKSQDDYKALIDDTAAGMARVN